MYSMVLNITTKQNKKLFGTENENANTELQSQIKCLFDINQYPTFIRATYVHVVLCYYMYHQNKCCFIAQDTTKDIITCSLPSNIHVYVINKVLSSCNGFSVVTLVLYYSIQIHRYFRHSAIYINNF